jgi:hypothetical protein
MSELEEYGLEALLQLGKTLDQASESDRDSNSEVEGETVAMELARRWLHIRDRNGDVSSLIANPAQASFARRQGRQNIVVKARQMGITSWVAGRFFLKTITGGGVLTVQVAHTRQAAEGIFRMVQRFWEHLPEDLRKGCLKRSRANVGQMAFPELDSEFRILSAADGGAGRGLTVQNLHCSELSRWPGDARETLAGLRASLVPGGELVLESTPNGAYGCFYEEWQQADDKEVVKHFFPWWKEPAYVSAEVTELRDDELALIQEHGLSSAQIGYRRGLEASYRGLRTQEFAEDPELCFRTSGDCCFDLEAVERNLLRVQDPIATRRNGSLRIWLPAQPGREYLVAVDPAGGGSDGDFAAVQVIDLKTGVQCAELQQRLGTLELARVAAELGREYNSAGGAALIAVERNNHGFGVLAYLDAVEHYARVYGQEGVAGWLTSSGSKPAMVSRLGALLVESPSMFPSRSLLDECRTFVSHRGGRTGAANGAHDDCVMAMALAHAVRAEMLQSGSRR